MTTISVDRVIAADPTSAALLLAGSTAFDLWPGMTPRVEVHALRPQRLRAAYVTGFDVTGEGLPDTAGTVMLSYVVSDDAPVATAAALSLRWTPDGSAVERARMTAAFRAMADAFLANLAAVAEERSDAA